MTRKLLLVLALVGMMFAGTAHAGRFSNFSFGYSDFGHHGGYNISVGGFGGRHWGGLARPRPRMASATAIAITGASAGI